MKFDCLLQYAEYGAEDRDFPDVPPHLLEDIFQVQTPSSLHVPEYSWIFKVPFCVVSAGRRLSAQRRRERSPLPPVQNPSGPTVCERHPAGCPPGRFLPQVSLRWRIESSAQTQQGADSSLTHANDVTSHTHGAMTRCGRCSTVTKRQLCSSVGSLSGRKNSF